MSSSYHNSAEPNQNLGNVLGSKPSVKISWAAKQQVSWFKPQRSHISLLCIYDVEISGFRVEYLIVNIKKKLKSVVTGVRKCYEEPGVVTQEVSCLEALLIRAKMLQRNSVQVRNVIRLKRKSAKVRKRNKTWKVCPQVAKLLKRERWLFI
mmetsp:Transcript_19077/g.23419  ORF Transcript_19077/g.23419 Transcript_19077/m.23419 type:complete len:151 (-) Transcript_19077:449-901(-)